MHHIIIATMIAMTNISMSEAATRHGGPSGSTGDPVCSEVVVGESALTDSSLTQFEALQTEWLEALEKAREKASRIREPEESAKIYSDAKPSAEAFATRFLSVAEANPGEVGARDALLWIVLHEGAIFVNPIATRLSNSLDPSSKLLSRATDILSQHHFDDLQVARTALSLDNLVASQNRDRLLHSLVDRSRDRAVRGSAMLALAQYLRRKETAVKLVNATNKHVPQMSEAYEKQLRAGASPEAIRSETIRLLDAIMADYADVPYARARGGSQAKTDRGRFSREVTQEDLGRKLTLSDVAEKILDETTNLGIGKPAPEIEGLDFRGVQKKLSDYRGKVVVLVFWGSWCAPCIQELPTERRLAERFRERRFAILGVNCREEKVVASAAIDREAITWPNWHDEDDVIVERYHISGFPSIFVLDDKGTIRAKKARGAILEETVEALLNEIDRPLNK